MKGFRRPDDAFQQFEDLLTIDPEDAMGSALKYVPALIEHGKYQKALAIHTRYTPDIDSTGVWTDALLAWATGNRDQAGPGLTGYSHRPYA